MACVRAEGTWCRRLAPPALLLGYCALAIAYQRAVPLFEAPDEPSHVLYVAFVRSTGELPNVIVRGDVPGEGMEPPLYYLLLAPLYGAISGYDPELLHTLHQANLWIYALADWRSAPAGARVRMGEEGRSRVLVVDPALGYLRALRWGSLAFGLLAVLCTFCAARRASGSGPFALLCASLLAFSPQFLFVSAYVNNDVACAALGAAAFWLFADALSRERVARGHYAAAALLVALGMATKHSALPALAVTALAVFGLDRRPLRARLPDAGLAALLGLALASPVLISNVSRFGEVSGVSAVIGSSGTLGSYEKFGGLATYLRSTYPYTTFCTYWATFGWLNIAAPYWLYLAFFALTWSGGLGFVLGVRAERGAATVAPPFAAEGDASPRRTCALRRYLLATVLATIAAHVWINLRAVAPQGRHLFGAAPQLAALLAMGMLQLGGRRAFAVRFATAAGLAAVMAALGLYGVLGMLLPAYR